MSAPQSADADAALHAAARGAMRERLAQLCRHGEWNRDARAVGSGYAALDQCLPGGGWPLGAVTELLSDTAGAGELGLLLPALSRLARGGRYIAWVAPPYLPYAPALAQRQLPLERVLVIQAGRTQDAQWAAEQALRCPAIGAVLGWCAHIVDRNVRRLQLAAEAGGSLGILYRPARAALQSSPAALRLRLQSAPDGLVLEIQKARGGRAGLTVHLGDTDAVVVHSSARAGA
ncbi:MAG TPA: translesion DNA synthesis-associated protein ImuA [Steroidobacteraceae bacterium]|jgi:cell division inhibitor SulA/protein ImuA|nr:translesion DNA synthesis-associated protein ImuA [Steroidobacteraceae bacterium]